MPEIPIYVKIKLGIIKVHQRSPAVYRFWAKVNKDGPLHAVLKTHCWEWLGLSRGISDKNKGSNVSRYSYRLHFGPFETKLFVCHHCDNPTCVNPYHLFLGTHQDNMDDMVAKGRQNSVRGDKHGFRLHPETVSKGEKHCRAKLTEKDVLEIRARYIPRHEINGGEALAREFGVDRTAISQLLRRVTWKHLP